MLNLASLKSSIIFFILLLSSSSLLSQTQKEPKLGKISLEQLKKTADDKFPNAHAVVLFDYGDSYYSFQGNKLKLTFDRHIAIQFFDNTQFDLATFEVTIDRYGSNKDRLEGVKGYTYNLDDGKFSRTKFSKKDIITEKVHDNRSLKKFTMPNVKEGSIIEVEYSVTSDFYTYMQPWYFQKIIPTRYSEYNIEIPEFFSFNKNFVGFYSPYIKPSKRDNVGDYSVRKEGWVMQDLPAFEIEDYMRSYKNYMSKIAFELRSIQIPYSTVQEFTRSWSEIGDDLMKRKIFGGEIKKGKIVNNIVNQYDGMGEEEKLIAIYEHIKKNIRWDGRTSLYSRKGIKKCLSESAGSSGDINLALIATLKKAGYDVAPVVLSTRANGMIPFSYPTIDKLNYVIARVNLNEKTYYLDATDDFLPASVLPIRCFNGKAVILGDGVAKAVNLKATTTHKSTTQYTLSITDDGTLEGELIKSSAGYAAIGMRKKISRADDEESYIEELENGQEGLIIEDHEFENLNNVYKDLRSTFTVTIDDKAEMAGDLIYLNPMLTEAITENPFKMEERKYPVDYAIPIEETYILKLDIPEGYAIESLPQGTRITLPEKGATFTFSAKVIGQKINVISRLKIKKTLYVESEYAGLKEFYNIILKNHSDQVVLKKI